MFALADVASTTRMLESAGFAASCVDEVALTYRLSDPDDLWSMVSEFAGPVSPALGNQDASVRADIRREIELRARRSATAPATSCRAWPGSSPPRRQATDAGPGGAAAVALPITNPMHRSTFGQWVQMGSRPSCLLREFVGPAVDIGRRLSRHLTRCCICTVTPAAVM